MTPETFGEIVARNMRDAIERPDNRPDGSGLDDGVFLPGCAPRKNAAPKSPDEIAEIRARAWATRRNKYGRHGHR
jgi:hypothetical protein